MSNISASDPQPQLSAPDALTHWIVKAFYPGPVPQGLEEQERFADFMLDKASEHPVFGAKVLASLEKYPHWNSLQAALDDLLPKQRQHIFTADQLLAAPISPPVEIVPNLFTEHRDVILGGAMGDGKTSICLQLGLQLALGLPLFGLAHSVGTDVLKPVRSYKVMYFDLELGAADFKQRMALNSNSAGVGRQFIYLDATHRTPLYGKVIFDNPNLHLPIIRDEINKHKPEIVIVDNLSLAFHGDVSKPEDCMRFRRNVDWLYHECPSVRMFLFPHHLTKPTTTEQGKPARISLLRDPRNWLGRVRGSGKLLDHFTVRLGFAREEVDGHEVCVINGISSHAQISPICLEQDSQTRVFCLHPDGTLAAKSIFTQAELKLWNQLPNPFTWADVVKIDRSAGQRMLKKAKDNGLVPESASSYTKVG